VDREQCMQSGMGAAGSPLDEEFTDVDRGLEELRAQTVRR